jgi:uncharacterized peroxidase-related enzyme
MTHIDTIAPAEAEGEVRNMYLRQQQGWGFVPNYAKVFSHRPAVMHAWADLQHTIRKNIDDKSYELVTLAAAQALGSSYCSLAHGKKLTSKYYSEEQLADIAADPVSEALTVAEQTMMRVAGKIVADSSSVSREDIDELREAGYSDAGIFDIAASAAARCFFSKLVDALGVQPDCSFSETSEQLKSVLCVGRPISPDAPEIIE